jgi:DNA-binding LacI/PurR family transcriptional regulator
LTTVLLEHRKRVPANMSVVAICPDDMAGTHAVSFTNIAVPAEDLGSIAVEMVMGQLEAGAPAETRLLAPVLTVRASTQPLGRSMGRSRVNTQR